MALNITVKQREAVQVQALQNTRTLRLRGTYTLNITENATLNTILNILPVIRYTLMYISSFSALTLLVGSFDP